MNKEYKKEEYNKLCAEFLGAIEYIPKPWYYFPRYQQHWFFPNRIAPNRFVTKMLKFDTNWNWIMEVVEKINSVDVYKNNPSDTTLAIIREEMRTFLGVSNKEAVVHSIWEFLNLYNDNK
jgi:hypothetical protein